MERKIKVMSIVGTRPELIRLSRVLAKLEVFTDHTLVHTGQNYDFELNQVFFDELKIKKPDFFLESAGENAAETIGKVIIATDQVLDKIKPDAVLVLGDTNSCLAVIPAKRRKIPVFHMEAGNRCFDQRVPEEINRKLVDHTSDINLTYSDIARDYLLREGFPPDRVIKTGSPMYEVLSHYRPFIDKSMVLETLGLRPNHFFVVSCHREENIESDIQLKKLVALLNRLSSRFGLPVIVSTHPRTRKRIDQQNGKLDPRVQLLKPLGLFDYVKLQMSSKVVLSDSGTITEESSILGFPALNLRESHERPEGMDNAAVMMVGLDSGLVEQAIAVALEQHPGWPTTAPLDYMVPNVSDKVVRLILSYTDYVNRNVWKKSSI
ncbi:UDP-N-acetylglucosamine 2-epimerase (non-hydrolyzing) [bacterium]|nr:UDP-N-acetylglucosamine 2-epimerase (non-hydrolyzing) [bacterium]NBX83703.1 UDP-N-acetylglucosamine 2-epimerase (non-hydrolyzing) [bacterium]